MHNKKISWQEAVLSKTETCFTTMGSTGSKYAYCNLTFKNTCSPFQISKVITNCNQSTMNYLQLHG